MSFYDRLIAETEKERIDFTSIPLIREAVRSGASRELYLDFLTQAYHHVKHTFPLLAFAAARTTDEAYQDALVEYMEEERGHEKWILNDIEAMGGNAAAVRDGDAGHRLPGDGGLHLLCDRMGEPLRHARQRARARGHVDPARRQGRRRHPALARPVAARTASPISARTGRSTSSTSPSSRRWSNGIPTPTTQQIVIDASKVFYRLYGDIYHELATRHPIKSHAA